jgi:plastocyanin
MRRGVLLVVMTLIAAVVPGLPVRASGPPVPTSVGDACQPDPSVQGPQVLHCRYGPLTVTPGANMILFGPVSIESPRADGFITSFSPNLVDATTGQVPPVHVVHLHHGVWLNASQTGTTPFFATGEEKTRSIIPPGYGYRTRPDDAWVLNYMLHNLTPNPFTVFIRYDLTWVPPSTPGIKEVVPVWLDAVGHKSFAKSIYPVYDPPKDGSGYTETFSADQDAEIVWVGGHVHPGGVRDELRSPTCGNKLLFTSEAVMNQGPPSFGSWDYRMTVTPPDWRFTVKRGDQISVTGYYDNAHPWYEAMAIMFAWAHPLTPEEMANPPTPACSSPPTTGQVTDAPYAPETNPQPVFGGDGEHPLGTPPASAATTNVLIAGFNYYPGGGTGQPSGVHAGDTVTFTNADASASIFHTVTSCANPCNGLWGQKYPLATWLSPTDLGDSGQLGFGPPAATAATQRVSWSFTVPTDAPVGEVFTYFCRIHPVMRGSLEVVAP